MENTVTRREALLRMGILTVGLAASAADCARNPATGKRQLILMSEAQEVELGRQSYPQVVQTYGIYNDKALQSWFNSQGQALVKVTTRKNIEYTYTILDDPTVNAFALPGGFIFFPRGILAYFNNMAQFEGVLGHETGHVVARHSAEQYSQQELANLGLGLGSLISSRIAQLAPIFSLGTQLLFLKFSRDDERQSDQLGVQYITELGYDGNQMALFFATLDRLSSGQGGLPEWASTHPDPGDREKKVRELTQKYQKQYPRKTYTVGRNEYLNRINNMVYGEDPRNGYVQNGVFYQPTMGFMFPVPSGWKVSNQASSVQMAPSDGGAMVMFRQEEGSSPGDAASKFASANSVQVASSGAVTVNGMSAFRTIGQLSSQSENLGIESCYIPFGGKVFAFHGVAPSGSFEGSRGVFEHTYQGFNRVANQSALNVTPKKVEIRSVKGTRTLSQAFGDFGVPSNQRDTLAIMNGMNLGDRVTGGTLIKVVG